MQEVRASHEAYQKKIKLMYGTSVNEFYAFYLVLIS
ncbi:hypothetical protein [Staphylococcus haemolyticus]